VTAGYQVSICSAYAKPAEKLTSTGVRVSEVTPELGALALHMRGICYDIQLVGNRKLDHT
jgi:hypothetical protein